MICITVAPQSRTLAKADLLNAAHLGDIVELRLDTLIKEPDVKELISGIPKPILISCRRPEDGGEWRGDEAERLMLLRQAIVAGPAYVELDLDIANLIPRYGNVQRVISFTRLDRPETDIDNVFYQATNAKADIVKFAWPTPTIDDAWPLLAAVSQKRVLPVVGMGLGRAELTFSLLGLKYGSPWIYAALEPGMEEHPGQANVFELDETYHWRDIHSKTSFVAVAGFGECQSIVTRMLNEAFRKLDAPVRCLPMEVGDVHRLKKMLDALKIKAIILSGDDGDRWLPLAEHVEDHDGGSGRIDLLLNRSTGWHGYNTLWRAGLKALESAPASAGEGHHSLKSQHVLVAGHGSLAHSMVRAVLQRKGPVSVCGLNDKSAQHIAQQAGCRFVPFQNLYDTLADVMVIADSTVEAGFAHGQINPSLFRPNMTVLDISRLPLETTLLAEARQRGCKVIDSQEVLQMQLSAQFKAITGKEMPGSN